MRYLMTSLEEVVKLQYLESWNFYGTNVSKMTL